jgi:hypothetical protein
MNNNSTRQQRVPCTNIKVYPQLNGQPTCWFNAIVMTILFSQYSRNMVYANQANWAIMPFSLQTKFKTVVNDTSGNLNFNYLNMTPEELLKDLRAVDPSIFYIHTTRPHNSVAYLTRLYDFLGAKKSLYFAAREDKATNMIDAHLLLSHHFTKVAQQYDGSMYYDFEDVRVRNRERDVEEYDYLVFDFSNRWYALSHEHVGLDLLIPMQDFKSPSGFIWSGKEYVLDSMIWTSTDYNHIIAGITCDGERYIYSGYEPQKQDFVPLYKYDWLHDQREMYCLKEPVKAGFSSRLHHPTDNVYCFNPGHGTKQYIFVNKKYMERRYPQRSARKVDR